MNRRIKAVIFDLDGVITDTAELHFKAWQRLAREINIYFDREINKRLKGVDRLASLEIILEKSKKQYTPEEKHILTEIKNSYYRQELQSITPDNILPGALKALNVTKGRGIKTAIASASKNAFSIIDKLELRQYFNYIVDSGNIKKGKPDPEIFLCAAANLNTDAKSCIGVEDSKAGIKAIKAAGMFALGIGRSDELEEADRVIMTLEEFNIEEYENIVSTVTTQYY